MRKNLFKIITLGVVSSSFMFASGWRIPEQSASSVALSGAYVANATGSEASYFNPANMSFNEDANLVSTSLNYINLPSITYTDATNPLKNGKSKVENFLVPTMFFSSKDYKGFRYGFSITAPGGLSKKWDSPYEKAFAQEFTLKIIEANPSISYKVKPNFSVGFGLRVVYSDGKVRSDASGIGKDVQRDMEGDTVEFGYNLAISYKPKSDTTLSATYRSNVDIKEDGNAKLYLNGTKVYDGGSSVTIPLPAVLALAISHTFNKKTTLELEYDRTYWSKYKQLDFNYASAIPAILVPSFDNPAVRNWKDSDAFRIGVIHQYSDKLKLMAGFAIDKTPIPSSNMGYELPGSDAKLYSVGFEYKYSDKITIGMGYLYDDKDDRTITATDANAQGINGTFKDISAHLLTFSMEYKF